MQVLVLLAQAQGAVVSRDELIERCWGGRIVVENAIHRVISRIRQVMVELGLEGFELETITKVGYRIAVVHRGGPQPDPPALWPSAEREPPPTRADPSPTRRRFLVGGVAAATLAAGAGAVLWIGGSRHVPVPEAVELHRRGQIAQRQGVAEQVRQGIAFFQRATEIDPLYAEAWGGLALSYRHILEGFAEGDLAATSSLIESAARRALALDANNADAQLALALVRPYFGNLARIEQALLRIERHHPDHWFVQAQLGLLRYEAGRWRDGLPHTERQLTIEPYILIPRMSYARALWSVGRLHEAEAELDGAMARWPGSFLPWHTKFTFLLFNRRSPAAIAFVMNPETRPENLRPDGVEARVVLARAAERRDPPDIAASLADLRRQAAMIGTIPNTAPAFVLLGEHDLAFAALDRYYFGGPAGDLGAAIPAPSGYERRYTSFLFMPPMAPLRRDPRFAVILERTGLDRYWRESGTTPDFRR